jgi:hypothetical protein
MNKLINQHEIGSKHIFVFPRALSESETPQLNFIQFVIVLMRATSLADIILRIDVNMEAAL